MNKCEACGRAFKKTSTKFVEPVNVDKLSNADLWEYRKQTCPTEDIKFQLRSNLPPLMRQDYETLLGMLTDQGGKHTPRTQEYYLLLQQDWREWRNQLERQQRTVAA